MLAFQRALVKMLKLCAIYIPVLHGGGHLILTTVDAVGPYRVCDVCLKKLTEHSYVTNGVVCSDGSVILGCVDIIPQVKLYQYQ
jgi:hypothetical protein